MRGNVKWLWFALAAASVVTVLAFAVPHTPDGKLKIGSPLDPNLGVVDPSGLKDLAIHDQNNYPVTKDMADAAEKQGAKKAADFSLVGTDGKTYTLTALTNKPLLIFFIEKECPCCLGAKYFVDKMKELYGDDVNAVGIINAEGKVAKAWEKTTKPTFTVLQDPGMGTIRAYAASRGVYTTLVAQDGTIDKAYPGYSIEMLQDLSSRIAKLAGVEDKGFESPAAPSVMTSGCLFPEPVPTKS